MRHTSRFLVLVALTAGMLHCRGTRTGGTTAPPPDGQPVGGEVGDWSSGETPGPDSGQAPAVARAAWGPAGTKYMTCPNALCESRRAPEGETIRGCEPGAPTSVEPPAWTVAPDDGSTCSGGYGGYGGVAAGSYAAMPTSPAVMAPPPPSMPSPVRVSRSQGVGNARPEELAEGDFAAADELIVIEEQERADARERDGDDADGPATAGSEEPAPTQGTLMAKDADGQDAGEFPLKHTEVSAEISGYIARTLVEQTYTNPYTEVIEAVYTFPLPGMAAVNDFVMQIGERKIVGLIRPREEAERIYAQARARGQTASLLTQERPNIFTQSVANIEPGGEVKIAITFFEKLAYENKQYEWVFPMVVGPRYIPGSPQSSTDDAAGTDGRPSTRANSSPAGDESAARSGQGGTAAPTDTVPDADRITPPVLRPGERSGHDIGVTVMLDAGLSIQELTPVTHCVDVEEVSDSRKVVKLSASDGIPNRDFVLRWKVAGADTQFGVLAHRGDGGGFLTLMMQPPAAPTDAQVTPREITFLIDVSGSQSGLPLGISKEIVRRTLDELRGEDAFNIFFFASGNGQLWEQPRPRTRENVDEAKRFLDQLCGGGGTEMLAGVQRALRADHDPKYLQMYVFLTDGYIGNEDEILRTIKEERGEARFFGFGVGSSVNRYLVDGIGEFGGGDSYAVLPRDPDHAGKAVQHLFDMIDSPILVDAKIDWNGLPVTDQFPAKLPDLFAGQTINVVARYTAAAEGTAYIEARVGAEHVRLPVAVRLPEREDGNAALAPIWARWRIAELSKEFVTADGDRQDELKRAITDLAVEFRLVSQFTAFVAVDESRIVGDGTPVRVVQPVELPEGVSYEGVFGESPVGDAFEVPAWGMTLQMSQSGKVRVGAVLLNGPAAQAGIAAGSTITRVDNTMVHDLVHLEGLVLQGGRTLKITFEPGGEVELPGP
ncbi:MAG: PDZ domain-containing protein [Deltaproteobacteria bacterium]|nr:PDZ domain-containing protein [Deltaproteobacteria bacterium]